VLYIPSFIELEEEVNFKIELTRRVFVKDERDFER